MPVPGWVRRGCRTSRSTSASCSASCARRAATARCASSTWPAPTCRCGTRPTQSRARRPPGRRAWSARSTPLVAPRDAALSPHTGLAEPRFRTARGAAILLAVLCAIAIGLWSGGWRVRAFIAGQTDLGSYFVPKYQYAADRIAAGELPLWNPYEFGGIPFLATIQPGVFYPPIRVAYAVLSGEDAHLLLFAMHVVIASLGALLLARDLGLALWPAVFAAAWVSQPIWLVRIYDHPIFLSAASWIPLLLLLSRRLVHAPTARRAALLGLVAAPRAVSGYPPLVLATAVSARPRSAVLAARARSHVASRRAGTRLRGARRRRRDRGPARGGAGPADDRARAAHRSRRRRGADARAAGRSGEAQRRHADLHGHPAVVVPLDLGRALESLRAVPAAPRAARPPAPSTLDGDVVRGGRGGSDGRPSHLGLRAPAALRTDPLRLRMDLHGRVRGLSAGRPRTRCAAVACRGARASSPDP